jgi:hypothetical protein
VCERERREREKERKKERERKRKKERVKENGLREGFPFISCMLLIAN